MKTHLASKIAWGGLVMANWIPAGAVAADIRGDLEFPTQWRVFTPLERDDPLPDLTVLDALPSTLVIGDKTLDARTANAVNSQFDFRVLPDFPANPRDQVSYAFIPLQSPARQTVTLGLGAEWLIQAWLNGEEIFNNARDDADAQVQRATPPYPPAIRDFMVEVDLREGRNVLVVRNVGGNRGATVAVGGPRELRAGNFNSILNDPLLMVQALPQDALGGAGRWMAPHLRAASGEKPASEIGSRLELFVDDFLVDRLTGGARRRMHHPIPREVVMAFGDQGTPWDQGRCAFPALVRDGERIRIYYSGQTAEGRETTAVIESTDGVHFTRPNLGIHEFQGSADNNVIFASGTVTHNFAPFLDENPDAAEDARFKALGRGPGGMRFYASPDGIDWRLMEHEPNFTSGPTDTQNLAFWDPVRERYIAYLRFFRPHRCIRYATSPDLVNWTETLPVEFSDNRLEDLYTNVIGPYFRAPHIFVGLPNRFVPDRKKVPEHPYNGVNDIVLMSSRDGKLFDRWEDAFIRADTDRRNWTDRNLHAVWGMLQTAPEEISLYVMEHNRHPTLRIRRWTVRTDGFASLHAGGEVGEMLTRPLIFEGDRLVVNYATAAIGTLRFELSDIDGAPIDGFGLSDSKPVYGNEIEHVVEWSGGSDLSELKGRPVRLRVRLLAADLYAIRFANATEITD